MVMVHRTKWFPARPPSMSFSQLFTIEFNYSRFKVTFQSPVPKFVFNIQYLHSVLNLEYCVEFAKPNLHVGERSTELKY